MKTGIGILLAVIFYFIYTFGLADQALCQEKFFEVASGDTTAPLETIRIFVGEKPFSIVSDWNGDPAFPKSWKKTNAVYGPEYARHRSDIVALEFGNQVVKTRTDPFPSNKAGLWIKIEPTTPTVVINSNLTKSDVGDMIMAATSPLILTIKNQEKEIDLLKNRKSELEELVAGFGVGGGMIGRAGAHMPHGYNFFFQLGRLELGWMGGGGQVGQQGHTPYFTFAFPVMGDEQEGLDIVVVGLCSFFAKNDKDLYIAPYRNYIFPGLGAGVKIKLMLGIPFQATITGQYQPQMYWDETGISLPVQSGSVMLKLAFLPLSNIFSGK